MPDDTPCVSELVPPPPIEFGRILHSHLGALCTAGRTPRALLISEVEAGRCGIAHGTQIMGLPIKLTARIPLGRACLELDSWTEYEFALPLRFTED